MWHSNLNLSVLTTHLLCFLTVPGIGILRTFVFLVTEMLIHFRLKHLLNRAISRSFSAFSIFSAVSILYSSNSILMVFFLPSLTCVLFLTTKISLLCIFIISQLTEFLHAFFHRVSKTILTVFRIALSISVSRKVVR